VRGDIAPGQAVRSAAFARIVDRGRLVVEPCSVSMPFLSTFSFLFFAALRNGGEGGEDLICASVLKPEPEQSLKHKEEGRFLSSPSLEWHKSDIFMRMRQAKLGAVHITPPGLARCGQGTPCYQTSQLERVTFSRGRAFLIQLARAPLVSHPEHMSVSSFVDSRAYGASKEVPSPNRCWRRRLLCYCGGLAEWAAGETQRHSAFGI